MGCIVHSIGMCNEYPMVPPLKWFEQTGYDGVLQTDMTVCVESYIGERGGREGVKLEQMVRITRLDEADGGGVPALMSVLERTDVGTPLFAPPILEHGALFVCQTAAICIYLGDLLGLSPRDEPGRWRAAHLQITMADFIAEIHDTHHPIAGALYYEDQKPEALRRAEHFRSERLPKFLTYFERVLEANADSPGWLVGSECSHADLSLFQIGEELGYAFPNALRSVTVDCPRTRALCDRVADRPGIAAYLESDRRIPFNQHGIFRHYPELDQAA